MLGYAKLAIFGL